MIAGFFGFQRSGKSAGAMFLARWFERYYQMPIYTNLQADGVIQIERLSQLPIDFKPKVLLLDEVNFMLDSRAWKDNSQWAVFLNTVGKQKILLLMTAIYPGLVEVRLRGQMNYIFVARDAGSAFEYLVVDVIRNRQQVARLPKSPDLFSALAYDSDLVVPNIVDFDVDDFIKRARLVKCQ